MKTSVQEEWLENLRSGSYKQAKRCLRDENNCYCCLGVLLDMEPNGKWIEQDEYEQGADRLCEDWMDPWGFEDEDGNWLAPEDLPYGPFEHIPADKQNEIARSIGTDLINSGKELPYHFDTALSTGRRLKISDALAYLNDGGYSFEQLADIIEREGIDPRIRL